MRVAVPLFGNQVAPRFGFTRRFLLADIERGKVLAEEIQKTVASGGTDCLIKDLLTELDNLGVKVILCGGCDLQFAPLAESMGIHVIDGVYGDASQVVKSFSLGNSLHSGDWEEVDTRHAWQRHWRKGALGEDLSQKPLFGRKMSPELSPTDKEKKSENRQRGRAKNEKRRYG